MLHYLFKRNIQSYQTLQQVKKFYKDVTVEPYKNDTHPLHKYAIKLDNKLVKTPNKHVLASIFRKLI